MRDLLSGMTADRSPHVLVVDDEIELLQVLAGYLTRIGFRVTAASEPDEAMRTVHESHVDVLLTDLCLEGASGMDLIERFWTVQPDAPAVLMSGTMPALGEVPGLTFVSKPFVLADIAGVLRRTLRGQSELADA